jgi:hypothetical protein
MIFFRSILLLLTLTISIPTFAASLNAQLRVSSAFENNSTGSVIELEIIPPESDTQSSTH